MNRLLAGVRPWAGGCLILALPVSTLGVELESFTWETAVGASADARYSVTGAVIPAEPGTLTDLRFQWSGEPIAVTAPVSIPPPESPLLFDNTAGSGNDVHIVSGKVWIAGQFCVAEETTVTLHSISLTLSSREPNSPVEVHLGIREAVPGTGKPGAEIGAEWTLSGDTNPVRFTAAGGTTERVLTWVPVPPSPLSPGRCYWVEFHVGVGEVLAPVTFTPPIGSVAALGSTWSDDAGQTWRDTDNESNFRMRIRGISTTPPRLNLQRRLGDRWEVSFQGTPGRSYVLEARQQIEAGPWIELPETRVTAGVSPAETTVPLPASVAEQTFYRLREDP
ncbi:MAG: hypothetical protein IT581_03390 [Verrucomicrobiales bacterium]|nr:hypothetical protein [Verrucomicrobiales bacterium]